MVVIYTKQALILTNGYRGVISDGRTDRLTFKYHVFVWNTEFTCRSVGLPARVNVSLTSLLKSDLKLTGFYILYKINIYLYIVVGL